MHLGNLRRGEKGIIKIKEKRVEMMPSRSSLTQRGRRRKKGSLIAFRI